jgi:hypothetical protein
VFFVAFAVKCSLQSVLASTLIMNRDYLRSMRSLRLILVLFF